MRQAAMIESGVADAGKSAQALAELGWSAMDTWMKAMLGMARVGASMVAAPAASAGTCAASCCDIPPPCWLPVDLGEVRSLVCAGGRAVLRIRVTNGLLRQSDISAAFAPADAASAVTPASLQLSPMERGWLTATVDLPAESGKGNPVEHLLWIRGCRTWFVRWIVEHADGMSSCCHEIDVKDAQDPVHHWYDHFYCRRACATRQTTGQ